MTTWHQINQRKNSSKIKHFAKTWTICKPILKGALVNLIYRRGTLSMPHIPVVTQVITFPLSTPPPPEAPNLTAIFVKKNLKFLQNISFKTHFFDENPLTSPHIYGNLSAHKSQVRPHIPTRKKMSAPPPPSGAKNTKIMKKKWYAERMLKARKGEPLNIWTVKSTLKKLKNVLNKLFVFALCRPNSILSLMFSSLIKSSTI